MAVDVRYMCTSDSYQWELYQDVCETYTPHDYLLTPEQLEYQINLDQ